MTGWLFDTKIALRGLLRRPALVAGALITLGIGIGANLALFSLLHDVVLRPLPYDEPDRLVAIRSDHADGPSYGVSLAEIEQLATDLRGAEGVAAAILPGMDERITLDDGDRIDLVEGVRVSANFFDVLGVRPAIGDGLDAQGLFALAEPAVLLSYDAWRSRFGADADLVGSSLQVNGRAHRVAGVMPEAFEFGLGSAVPELYVYRPLSAIEDGDDTALGVQALARMAPGVGLTDLQAELTRLQPMLDSGTELEASRSVVALPLERLLVGDVGTPLRALGLAAALVLLVACANLGTLLVARQSERTAEQALRSALGAGRSRLARLPLLEAMLLGAGGAALGLLVAGPATDLAISRMSDPLFRYDGFGLGPGVVSVAIGLAATAGLLFGAVPAWLAGGARPAGVLRSGGRSGNDPSTRTTRFLAGAEAAALVVLLAATGLSLRSLGALVNVDLGFESEGRAVATVLVPRDRYPTVEAFGAFVLEMEERVREIPGVTAAGTITHVPLDPMSWGGSLAVEGEAVDPDRALRTDWELASPGYFEAAGIPVVQGRPFRPDDLPSTEMVTVVSRTLAEHIAPAGDAIGRRISGTGPAGPWMTVVGVVEDVRQKELGGAARPYIYVSHAQMFPFPERELVLATTEDPMQAMRAAEQELRALEPGIVLAYPRPMQALVDRALGRPRLVTTLLMAFGAVSLLLALTGVYGVTAYGAARRRREIGIRACLGATRPELMSRAVGEALVPVAIGTAVGLALTALVAPRFAALLHGVRPLDAVTMTAVPALLLVAAAAAAWLPGWRAARTDPATVLRQG